MRMLFSLGMGTLKKWFKMSSKRPSLVIKVITLGITTSIVLHHLPVLSRYNHCLLTHRGLSTWQKDSVTGWPAHHLTCGH